MECNTVETKSCEGEADSDANEESDTFDAGASDEYDEDRTLRSQASQGGAKRTQNFRQRLQSVSQAVVAPNARRISLMHDAASLGISKSPVSSPVPPNSCGNERLEGANIRGGALRKTPSNGSSFRKKASKDGNDAIPSAVRFDPATQTPRSSSMSFMIPSPYVDDLAMERSAQTHWEQRIAKHEQAILHHRDSVMLKSHRVQMGKTQEISDTTRAGVAEDTSSALLEQAAPPASARTSAVRAVCSSGNPRLTKAQMDARAIATLRRHEVFARCSDQFLSMIASAAEYLNFKPGDARMMDGSRVGVARVRPAMAIVVDTGNFRIEIGRTIVDEVTAGYDFGLVNVLVNATVAGGARYSTPGPQPPLDFVARASVGQDIHRALAINSIGLRHALQECPQDHLLLQEVVHMVNQAINSTHHCVTLLQSCENARKAIAESMTRHVFVREQCIFREGQKSPDGLLLIRSGTIAIEINGVEVRRLIKGHAIGEDMLFGVSRKWSMTARCITMCDVVVLHRRLFTSSVRELQNGNAEDIREAERLLLLLEGTWREDKLILAWPLFQGYDQDLLSALAQLIETRVLLPSNKLWEGGAPRQRGEEIALYVLLSGTCEETTTTERQQRQQSNAQSMTESRSVKRTLIAGTCVGTREFLGLSTQGYIAVKARALCIVAVLHRAVFLKAVADHSVEAPQATEITRLLKEELDSIPAPSSDLLNKIEQASLLEQLNKDVFIGGLPIFHGHDKRFIDRICDAAAKRRFCIAEQTLCRAGARARTMFVLARGEAYMSIAGLQIQVFSVGEAFNTLALAEDGFKPSYSVSCAKTSEFWSIACEDFSTCLDAFPFEKSKFVDLHAPSDLEIRVRPRKHRSKEIERRTSSHGSSVSSSPDSSPKKRNRSSSNSSTVDTRFCLSDIDLFRECSQEFLNWIANHLEAKVYFPNEILVREGENDSSLYIIRHGSVVTESSDEGQAQAKLESGSSVGERRLLGIDKTAQNSTQAIEVAVVQILHQSVFRKALDLFPDQVLQFEDFTLSQMEGIASFDVRRTKMFEKCSKAFCAQLERIITTHLAQPDSVIVEEGSEEKVIRIIKSGVAIVDEDDGLTQEPERGGALYGLGAYSSVPLKAREPTHMRAGTTLNAGVVLGTTRCVTMTVRAESLCAIGEIEGTAFISLLQRFPNEIVPLLRSAASQLWPTDPESVPLFSGVSSHFFAQLMDESEWHMYLPNQCVVKQGGRGDLLFLLCYGVAVAESDGIPVGNTLVRGDCVGKTNFFKLNDRYMTTVRARSVCHFRAISGASREMLLEKNVAERRRFEGLKAEAQADAAQQELAVKEQATRERLWRREEIAFRGHVTKRERAKTSTASMHSTSSMASLLEESTSRLGQEDASIPLAMRGTAADGGDAIAASVELSTSTDTKPPSTIASYGQVDSSFLERMRVFKQTGADPGSSQAAAQSTGKKGKPRENRLRNLAQATSSSPEKKTNGKSQKNEQDKALDSVSDCSTSGDECPSMPAKGLTTAGAKGMMCIVDNLQTAVSKLQRMDSAILSHAGARHTAFLKGRMLRLLQSGTVPSGEGSLSQKDLHELNFQLPALPAHKSPGSTLSSSLESGELQSSMERLTETIRERKEERAALISVGEPPMRCLPAAAEQALRRKYRQLSTLPFGAVLPSPA